MALVECLDCGKEISTTAYRCPQCGSLQNTLLKSRRFLIGCVYFFGALFLIGLVMGFIDEYIL